MKPPLAPAEIEALRRLDACALANAIESFRTRLRNEGFMDGSIRCLFPQLRPMLGHAVTLKIRGASPPTGATTYADRTDWWDYVLSVPAPRVVVVEDVSSRRGQGALLGEVHVAILRRLGVVGAVTNGSVRDLPAVEELGFPLFAGSLSVSHAYVHVVETGRPVTVGGLAVESGDLLHGDLHGVQSIPREVAAAIPAVAARFGLRDRAIVALCRSEDFSLEKLRAALAPPPA
jgi:4-hydroxy-4-methyl-2-oxoglutarate aldolase